ncbi:hypothetical protein D3C85_1777120 [compost metagenome]
MIPDKSPGNDAAIVMNRLVIVLYVKMRARIRPINILLPKCFFHSLVYFFSNVSREIGLFEKYAKINSDAIFAL